MKKNKEKCTAIVLAAGQGKRMGTSVQKQYIELYDKPVIYYTLNAFEQSEIIDRVILVVGADQEAYVQKEIVDKYGLGKVCRIVAGGEERYDSVWRGLCALREIEENILSEEKTSYVFIHDGARPFITEEMLERGLEGTRKTGACVLGMPSKDTVKLADKNAFVESTPERNYVWTVQTPQIFLYSLIKTAHDKIRRKDMSNITDDAMVIEQETGVKVALAKGSYQNIKITTPEDLWIAEAFLRSEKM